LQPAPYPLPRPDQDYFVTENYDHIHKPGNFSSRAYGYLEVDPQQVDRVSQFQKSAELPFPCRV
jgi:hypothetical protein